jgi:O-antigen ligase
MLTLAWGPHWPFSAFGIVAPPFSFVNAAFDLGDLLVAGILVGWALALVLGRDRLCMRPYWISGLLLLFVLAAACAIVHALDQAAALRFAVRSAGLAALYLYLTRNITAGRLSPATISVWLAPGMALNGLLAIAQAIHQNPLGLRWLGEPQMARTTRGTAVVLVHGEPMLRAYGVLPHPNVLGGLLAAALPLVAGSLMTPASAGAGRHSRVGNIIRDLLLLLCLVIMTAGLLLSFSRSAWLGLLVGAIYLLHGGEGARLWSVWRTLVVGVAVGLALLALLVIEWNAVLVRLWPESNALEQFSLQQRLTLLSRSFSVIAWHPWTGVGGNNFATAEARVVLHTATAASSLLPVHNTYLLAQAELGVLGATAWLALMAAPLLERVLHARRPAVLAATGSASYAARAPERGACSAPARQRGGEAPLLRRALRLQLGRHEHAAGTGAVGAPEDVAGTMRWHRLAGSSLLVVATVGLFDFYIWVNEPVAVLWVLALALFAATGPGR